MYKQCFLYRAANNFPAGAGQIIRSNQFLLGHIPFLAGQIVWRPSKDLTGRNLFLTGHCPLTGRYLQPCSIEAKSFCGLIRFNTNVLDGHLSSSPSSSSSLSFSQSEPPTAFLINHYHSAYGDTKQAIQILPLNGSQIHFTFQFLLVSLLLHE